MTKYYLYYVLIYGGLGAFIPYIVPYLEGSLEAKFHSSEYFHVCESSSKRSIFPGITFSM